MDLCKYTEEIWKLYVSDNMEEVSKHLFEAMGEDIVIIGTGLHEFYENLDTFKQAFAMEDEERNQIKFHLHSFKCQEKKLDENNSIVYGNVHMKGRGIDTDVIVDMDTRVTMVYSKRDGKWELVHIHQSIPSLEQGEGEYYPKTLMDQINETQMRVNELEIQTKMDLLTGLLNHRAFYDMAELLTIAHATGYFMMIDIDDFKQINDTYGHLYGDSILAGMGTVLKGAIGAEDFAGRIGGDEFALFCEECRSPKEATDLAEKIIRMIGEYYRQNNLVFYGISIGIAGKSFDRNSREVLKHADEKMYEAKRSGKNSYRI